MGGGAEACAGGVRGSTACVRRVVMRILVERAAHELQGEDSRRVGDVFGVADGPTMWLVGCCTTLLLSARRAFGSQIFAQASASGGPARLQRALDSVDPSGPPQVHLTFPQQLAGAQGGRPELASLMVMDSSFNPPTRAHMHLLTSSMQRFGCGAPLPPPAQPSLPCPAVLASPPQLPPAPPPPAPTYTGRAGRSCCSPSRMPTRRSWAPASCSGCR